MLRQLLMTGVAATGIGMFGATNDVEAGGRHDGGHHQVRHDHRHGDRHDHGRRDYRFRDHGHRDVGHDRYHSGRRHHDHHGDRFHIQPYPYHSGYGHWNNRGYGRSARSGFFIGTDTFSLSVFR